MHFASCRVIENECYSVVVEMVGCKTYWLSDVLCAGMGADSAGCSEMERESCHSSWRSWSHHRSTAIQQRTATRRTSPCRHIHRSLRYRSVTILELDYVAARNRLPLCLSVAMFFRFRCSMVTTNIASRSVAVALKSENVAYNEIKKRTYDRCTPLQDATKVTKLRCVSGKNVTLFMFEIF